MGIAVEWLRRLFFFVSHERDDGWINRFCSHFKIQ